MIKPEAIGRWMRKTHFQSLNCAGKNISITSVPSIPCYMSLQGGWPCITPPHTHAHRVSNLNCTFFPSHFSASWVCKNNPICQNESNMGVTASLRSASLSPCRACQMKNSSRSSMGLMGLKQNIVVICISNILIGP